MVVSDGNNTTLGEGLPAEMARVRDEVLPAYLACGPSAAFAVASMRNDLDCAARAMAAGDVVAMLRSYKALLGWHV